MNGSSSYGRIPVKSSYNTILNEYTSAGSESGSSGDKSEALDRIIVMRLIQLHPTHAIRATLTSRRRSRTEPWLLSQLIYQDLRLDEVLGVERVPVALVLDVRRVKVVRDHMQVDLAALQPIRLDAHSHAGLFVQHARDVGRGG